MILYSNILLCNIHSNILLHGIIWLCGVYGCMVNIHKLLYSIKILYILFVGFTLRANNGAIIDQMIKLSRD